MAPAYKFLSDKFERKFAAFCDKLNATDLTEELAVARMMLSEAIDEFGEADQLVAVTNDQKRVKSLAKSLAESKIQTWLSQVTSISERWDRIGRPVNTTLNVLMNAQFPTLIQRVISDGLNEGLDAQEMSTRVTELLKCDQDPTLRQTNVLPSMDQVVKYMDDTVPSGPIIGPIIEQEEREEREILISEPNTRYSIAKEVG